MPVSIRKFRIANPQRSAKRAKRRANRKRNPALVTLGFVNPHKGPSTMAKKRRKKNSAPRARRRKTNPTRRRRSNPSLPAFLRKRAKKTSHRRRRNPEVLGKTTDLMKSGAAALVGLVAARQAPQLLLGTRNSGILGYLATAIATFAVSYGVRKVAGNTAGHAAMIGGAMQFASRLLTEYVSPVGKVLSLSGIGDATAAGLGELRESYFPLPVATKPGSPWNGIVPRALQPAPTPASSASSSAPATMAGTNRRGTRFASRY